MKRTPLTRHKQLQSWGDWHRKRKPLPRESAKARKRRVTFSPARKAWLAEWTHCMNCGKRFYEGPFSSPGVHEIVGGTAMRQVTFSLPTFWLALCFPCNQDMGSVPNRVSFVRQLAVKLKHDPTRFDLEAANRIWQRNGNQEPVTLAELEAELDANA